MEQEKDLSFLQWVEWVPDGVTPFPGLGTSPGLSPHEQGGNDASFSGLSWRYEGRTAHAYTGTPTPGAPSDHWHYYYDYQEAGKQDPNTTATASVWQSPLHGQPRLPTVSRRRKRASAVPALRRLMAPGACATHEQAPKAHPGLSRA